MLASGVFLTACAPENRDPLPSESTQIMAARLRRIAEETHANPIRNVHANKARVARLRQVTPPSDIRQLISYRAQLAQELLHAGENGEAIEIFRGILDSLGANPDLYDAAYALAIKDYLAISYMRLGEQENCIENHNVDRCLWPIREGGIHTKEEGSRQAIEVYEEILNQDPTDLNAVWLMNVAYMTLGEYPDRVPKRWRIPPEALESEFDVGRFPDISPSLGIDAVGLSGGAVMDDLNGDGYLDIMASSWGLLDPIVYYENDTRGGFVDRTEAAGLTGIVGGLNLVHADYDNDGDLDVLALRGAWLGEGHPNSLLRNRGNGVFDDATEAAGLLTLHPTQTAAWGDYDNDGDLDLFVGNETSPQGGLHPCELFRNNGDGTFADVANEAGLRVMEYVKAVVWGDYDNDGRVDLYVSNWGAPNRLYRNEGPDDRGAWRFADVAASAGVQEPAISFPAWFWDYDNDGWLDIFVSGWKASAGDIAAEFLGTPGKAVLPRLYRNRGDGTFEDRTAAARLGKVMYSMGSNFGDLDNDGWLDFYVGTGDPDFRSLIPNRMFRNAGGAFFQEVTASGGFGHLQKGHGVAFGDADNDGDQDIYAVIGGAYEGDLFNNIFFENPGHGHSWITLKLKGKTSNRSAIGARIRIDVETPAGHRTIYGTVGTGGSFGASSLRQEIGLGDARRLVAGEITWPASGQIQRLENLQMNRIYMIEEGENPVEIKLQRLTWPGPNAQNHH